MLQPVELLHRSLNDFTEDFSLPVEVAHNIYEQHERDRQGAISMRIVIYTLFNHKFLIVGTYQLNFIILHKI